MSEELQDVEIFSSAVKDYGFLLLRPLYGLHRRRFPALRR
jgi:hypothetical protein